MTLDEEIILFDCCGEVLVAFPTMISQVTADHADLGRDVVSELDVIDKIAGQLAFAVFVPRVS
jgi:hypothetical protein